MNVAVDLTDSEKACLRGVAKGMSSKEIARETGLTPNTVDTYIKSARSRLGATNRRAAAREFARSEVSQNLRSPPPAVAPPQKTADLLGSRQEVVRDTPVRLFSVPPLGGRANELDWAERNYAVLKVGALSLSVIVALVLIMAELLWILS